MNFQPWVWINIPTIRDGITGFLAIKDITGYKTNTVQGTQVWNKQIYNTLLHVSVLKSHLQKEQLIPVEITKVIK